ncbi:MAG: hypothetical protein ACM3YO_05310 [Bacteroidota bacterium]
MANSILTTGAEYIDNVSVRVNDQLKAIQDLDPEAKDFQKKLLIAQTQLDALKKMMDAIDQAVRSFHRS